VVAFFLLLYIGMTSSSILDHLDDDVLGVLCSHLQYAVRKADQQDAVQVSKLDTPSGAILVSIRMLSPEIPSPFIFPHM
jgi:hypothetical protein